MSKRFNIHINRDPAAEVSGLKTAIRVIEPGLSNYVRYTINRPKKEEEEYPAGYYSGGVLGLRLEVGGWNMNEPFKEVKFTVSDEKGEYTIIESNGTTEGIYRTDRVQHLQCREGGSIKLKGRIVVDSIGEYVPDVLVLYTLNELQDGSGNKLTKKNCPDIHEDISFDAEKKEWVIDKDITPTGNDFVIPLSLYN